MPFYPKHRYHDAIIYVWLIAWGAEWCGNVTELSPVDGKQLQQRAVNRRHRDALPATAGEREDWWRHPTARLVQGNDRGTATPPRHSAETDTAGPHRTETGQTEMFITVLML